MLRGASGHRTQTSAVWSYLDSSLRQPNIEYKMLRGASGRRPESSSKARSLDCLAGQLTEIEGQRPFASSAARPASLWTRKLHCHTPRFEHLRNGSTSTTLTVDSQPQQKLGKDGTNLRCLATQVWTCIWHS